MDCDQIVLIVLGQIESNQIQILDGIDLTKPNLKIFQSYSFDD